MFIIFDLDGTLANDQHRLPLIKSSDVGPDDWDTYYKLCGCDTPILPMVTLLEDCISSLHHIEIWTARSQMVYDTTCAWLNYHAPKWAEYGGLLKMRPLGNTDPGVLIKQQWLTDCQADGLWPDLVFDDNPEVVEMYTQSGVTCCTVPLVE